MSAGVPTSTAVRTAVAANKHRYGIFYAEIPKYKFQNACVLIFQPETHGIYKQL